jgi:predicted ATPase/class 3 adenylate cyclase
METLLLPRGTVTFLFTDIEGSTALWERDRAAMREAVARQLAILHSLIAAHHGVLYKTIGDGTQAAFASAEEALRAAVAGQRALLAEDWGELGPIRVRMALHAGEAIPDTHGDYLAAPLNRLSRLLSAGHGSQILLSQAVQQLSRRALPAGSELQDLGEHRLRDLLEPERVYQLRHPDLPTQFPPLKTLDTRPNNLPLQPTPFIGRERELAEIAERLRAPAVHLLSLTGPGGTGKTRLALQAAADLGDDFADGVFFVALAAITDPELVPATIAEAVGIREAGGRPIRELLLAELCPQNILLVLDNFEQVTAGASVVTDLLTTCPHVKVLVTSRVPLRLRAEREYPVLPLPLPRRKPPPTAEQLSQFEAVRLFIERARAVRPDFAIDNATAPVVAEICHRLDGLPLAIELAAARAKLLPPAAMLARLEKRLPLLTGGARDLPLRQQTLRAAIAWSDDLLAPHEQVLFHRLAVFAGGATFEAIDAVADPDGKLQAFEAVSALLDHSLLRQEDGPADEPRLVMLGTIREYALERLHETGEAEETQRRHAEYFLALAERAEPELVGPDQVLWLDRLEAEHDNVRAALAWSLDHDPAMSIQLAAWMYRFWYMRGHLTEGRVWLERSLARGSTDVTPVVRVQALTSLGSIADFMGDTTLARRSQEEALTLSRSVGYQLGAVRALNGLGNLTNFEAGHGGDPELYIRSSALYSEALELSRELGDDVLIATILNNLGLVAARLGDLDRARTLLEENLGIDRRHGNLGGLAISLVNLAELRAAMGALNEARALFREAIHLAAELGYKEVLAQAFAVLGVMAANEGHGLQAVRLFGAATALAAAIGAPIDPVLPDVLEAAMDSTRAALGEETYTAVWESGGQMSSEEVNAEALAIVEGAVPECRRVVI